MRQAKNRHWRYTERRGCPGGPTLITSQLLLSLLLLLLELHSAFHESCVSDEPFLGNGASIHPCHEDPALRRTYLSARPHPAARMLAYRRGIDG